MRNTADVTGYKPIAVWSHYRTNGFTCLPKHGEAGDNKSPIWWPTFANQRCIVFAIVCRAHWPRGHKSFLALKLFNPLGGFSSGRSAVLQYHRRKGKTLGKRTTHYTISIETYLQFLCHKLKIHHTALESTYRIERRLLNTLVIENSIGNVKIKRMMYILHGLIHQRRTQSPRARSMKCELAFFSDAETRKGKIPWNWSLEMFGMTGKKYAYFWHCALII
jgi:hypothetical protein